jgi:hypothetical protein
MGKPLKDLLNSYKYKLGQTFVSTPESAAGFMRQYRAELNALKNEINLSANGALTRPRALYQQGASGSGDDFTFSTTGVPRTQGLRDFLAPEEFKKNIFGGDTFFHEKGEFHYLTAKTDAELFYILLVTLRKGVLLQGASILGSEAWNCRAVADKFVSHLEKGNGSDFRETSYLSGMMVNLSVYQKLFNEIARVFRERIRSNQGDFTNMTFGAASLRQFFPMGIGFNESPALKTLVGGVQELQVYLKKIQYGASSSGGNGISYDAELNIVIYDDFGVSENDTVNASFAAGLGRDGLIAMWMLQNQRGYKPFRTVFNFTTKLNGTF